MSNLAVPEFLLGTTLALAVALAGFLALLVSFFLLIGIYYRLGRTNRYLRDIAERQAQPRAPAAGAPMFRSLGCLLLLAAPLHAADTYRGGTLAGLPAKSALRIAPDILIYGPLSIPYRSINLFEHHPRDRDLTIHFLDQDARQQAAVFRLDRRTASATLFTLQLRTGVIPAKNPPRLLYRYFRPWRPR